MPVLEIEIVTRPGEALHPQLASMLADRAGEIFASPPGGTWVRLHSLPAEFYAENSTRGAETPMPVFVSILKSNLHPSEDLKNEILQLTAVIADLCDRPAQNVHLTYLPAGAGRVAFGGHLVE